MRKVAYDFGITNDNVNLKLSIPFTPKKAQKKSLRIKKKLFSKSGLAYWCVGGLQLVEEDLTSNKIYELESFWELEGEEVIAYHKKQEMVFAYYYGNMKYQILRTKYSKSRRRFINSPGITYGDVEYLDHDADHVVLTKSKKDAFYLRLFGVNAMFIVNERILIDNDLLVILKQYENIYTLFDNDMTGKRKAVDLKNKYGFVPLLFKVSDAKDTYNFLEKWGKDSFIDLIEETKYKLLWK